MLDESVNMISKFAETTMYRDILKQQHEEISHIMRSLEIPKRHSRSIDFLGSALKFVAGTPDHDDFKLLLTKQNILIENNNKQTKINSVLQTRINEITEQINTIKKYFPKDNVINNIEKTHLFEYLSNRNNLIVNYLNNIVLSIVLAKHNLVNPLILDEIDIKNLIENENLHSISINNLLLASKIKVLQNATSIHYILKVPKLIKLCIFLKLYPVSHNNTIVKLPVQQAAKCDDATYPIADCVTTTNEQICKPFSSKCLTELLNNNSAACETQSSYHLPSVQQIEDGIIILNDVYETTIEDKHQISVKGTLLIMFPDTIKINQTTYTARKNTTIIEAHPPKTVSLKFLDHDHQISLPYLHKLSIENTNVIQSLSDDIQSQRTSSWSITLIFIGLFCLIFISCVLKMILGATFKKSRRRANDEQMEQIMVQLNNRSETSRV